MPELHDRLLALAAEADWPPAQNLAPRVREAIAACAPDAAGRRAGGGHRLARRPAPALIVAAAIAIVLAGGLAAAPGVRSDLLERLGLKGATVTRVERLPPTRQGRDLALGRRVTLAGARAAVRFAPAVPAALGRPPEAYVDGGAVTFLYPGERPLLLTQVRGTAGPFVEKLADARAGVRRVDVAGARGLLVNGPHAVVFIAPDGRPREQRSRLAARTVLWERGGILLRLESRRGAAELLRIAQSVR